MQDVNPAGGGNEEEELLVMDMEDVGLPGSISSSPGFPVQVVFTRIRIRTSRRNGSDCQEKTGSHCQDKLLAIRHMTNTVVDGVITLNDNVIIE